MPGLSFSFILLPSPSAFGPLDADAPGSPLAVLFVGGLSAREDDVAGLVTIGRTVLSSVSRFTALVTRANPPGGHFVSYKFDSGERAADLSAARRQLCDTLRRELSVAADDASNEPHVLVWDGARDAPAVTAVHLSEWALVRHAADSQRLTCIYGEQLSPSRERAAAFADARSLPRPEVL